MCPCPQQFSPGPANSTALSEGQTTCFRDIAKCLCRRLCILSPPSAALCHLHWWGWSWARTPRGRVKPEASITVSICEPRQRAVSDTSPGHAVLCQVRSGRTPVALPQLCLTWLSFQSILFCRVTEKISIKYEGYFVRKTKKKLLKDFNVLKVVIPKNALAFKCGGTWDYCVLGT